MGEFIHKIPEGVSQALVVNGREYWQPALPYPFFTAQGLPFWKRFNEQNWRPKCDCGQIFETLDEYHEHYFREAGEA